MATEGGRRPASLAALFGKHQIASVVTTAIDFCVMIVLVSVVGTNAELGTACGAGTGAVVNFTLGRHFTFQATDKATNGTAHGQFVRYVLVSAASLGLNTLGVHLFMRAIAPGYYVIARVITATLVSFLWNFPMHRYFVFREGR
jgi:putative flippase GtrA